MKKVLSILAVVLFCGCATTGDWFRSDKVKGPLIGPAGARAEVFHRCTSGNGILNIYSSNAGGSCITAFKGPSGNLVEMGSISDSIDAHLQTLEGFSTWRFERTGSQSWYRAPLKFDILTIDPTIVLATPAPTHRRFGPTGGPMHGTPRMGSRLIEEGFLFDALPVATDVAYLFVPGVTKGLVEIRGDALPHRFSVAGATGLLSVQNGKWFFERER